ncbi:MAG: methylated-DNA--[protein]-cysteine S-methyltransferase [Bacteroidales bacterium]|jgi:AraC family transcriptional regulator of adaptative response/methylated-DNA-[protein]-cysteine methyltransferase|nr:methylated-DNA--[protein]-cysteine S-methyltransferase [Bacteroidales bacterium]
MFDRNIIYFKEIGTEIGNITACASVRGICLSEFSDSGSLDEDIKCLENFFGCRTAINGDTVSSMPVNITILFSRLASELGEYFKGKRKYFDLPLFLTGTDFQKKCWESLLAVPYGGSISYKEEAVSIGRPGAWRAVANANGRNKMPILIPCHRVISADGSMGGYSAGIWRKKTLLELENINIKML